MKPWQINIVLIVVVIAILGFLPEGDARKLVGSIIVIASAIWVYIDSKKLEINKYKKTILSLSTTPFGSAFVVFLLWPIAFPMYISLRRRIKDKKIPLKEIGVK